MADYQIRLANVPDFERIFEIWIAGQEISTQQKIAEGDIPKLKNELLNFFNDEKAVFLVAEANDTIIGWHAFYTVFRNPLLSGKAVQASTYIDPKCFSAGVGTRLVKNGMWAAKRRGARQIYLWITTNNIAAIKAISKFQHTVVKVNGVPDGLPDFFIYVIDTDTLSADSDVQNL